MKKRKDSKSRWLMLVLGLKSPVTNHQSPVSDRTHTFTLVELLMVCALLLFLMGLMIVGYGFASQKMAEIECRSIMAKISTALEQYKEKTGYYIQSTVVHMTSNKTSKENVISVFIVDDPKPDEVDFTDFLPDYEKMKQTCMKLDPVVHPRRFLVSPYIKTGKDIIAQPQFGTQIPFWYRCPGTHNRTSFDLESAGPDCKFGYYTNKYKPKEPDDTHLTIGEKHPTLDVSGAKDVADNIKNWE